MANPKALASPISTPVTAGAFQDALGTVLNSGRIILDLSQTAAVIGGGEVVPRRVTINLDVNGKVAASQVIWANDQLTPSGTTYKMTVYDSTGNFVGDFGNQALQGTAPIDLALLTPVGQSGGVISFINPVLLNPTGPQTITGFDLTVDQNFNVGGNESITGNLAVTGSSTVADISIKSINALAKVMADRYADVQTAINALPAAGGCVDARSTNVNLALGTINPGTKQVTLLLGPLSYTCDHIVIQANFRIIGSASVNVSGLGTIVTSVGANAQPLLVAPSSGLLNIRGAEIADITFIGAAGNTTQDGMKIDLSGVTAGSVFDHAKIRDVNFSAFKGKSIYLKGSATGASFVQFLKFDHVVAVRPSSASEALRITGATGQLDFYSCQFDGNAKGDGTNIYIGTEANGDTSIPYSTNFYGLTCQGADIGFQGSGFNQVGFYNSHHENINIVYQLDLLHTNSKNGSPVFWGGYFANAGANAGAGAILKVNTSIVYGCLLGNSSIVSLPDKLINSTSGASIATYYNGAPQNLSSPNITVGVDASLAPAATMNVGVYHTVALSASATSMTTINSQLGPGELITFFANGTCQFATGGNITLPGSASPLILATGENVTFENSDYSGTNTWRLVSISSATVTGKTLQGAGSGNNVNLLDRQGPAGAITGTGADANIYTFSIPANTIGAGKGIEVTTGFAHTTGTAAITYKLKLGGTTLFTMAHTDSATSNLQVQSHILNSSGVQNSQFARVIMYESLTIAENTFTTSAENTANTLSITLTFSVAATDQVTPKFWLVELIQ